MILTDHRVAKARGFTLVEVMVAGGLLAALLAGAATLVITMTVSSERIRRVADAQETARQALETLGNEIRAAGLGVGSGQILIAPGNVGRRIPVIYSGPPVVITEPGGATIQSDSIVIVTSESSSLGVAGDGSGMHGVLAAASPVSPGIALTVQCSDATGNVKDCSNGPIPAALPPLIVGDLANGAFVRPTALSTPPAGAPATQQLGYVESTATGFNPNPTSLGGFTQGSVISTARVSHWYLRQANDPANKNPAYLVRSRPTLTASTANPCPSAAPNPYNPFEDETTGFAAGGAGTPVVGADLGSGPVQALRIRYVVDPTGSDDPAQFQMRNFLSVCDTNLIGALREVRIQIVSRSFAGDRATDATQQVVRYSTPNFEGSTATATAGGGGLVDAYPRRAFVIRVVPRNLQGGRL